MNAYKYYNAFRVISSILILSVMLLQWTFRHEIVGLYTDILSTRREALNAIWLFSFNIFPDLFKGMMKGVIKALGIQHKAVYVHLLCHWCIFPSSIYFFVFSSAGPKLGIVGIWMGKITLEWCIISFYTLIIATSNWEEIAE